MGLVDCGKKKQEKDESLFCWKGNQVVTLKNFRVAYIGVRQTAKVIVQYAEVYI